MADVIMPESTPCKFDARGWNPCKRPSDNGLCSQHEGKKCSSCGEQALRSCDAQMGGLACGAILCDTCRHSLESGNHVTEEAYRTEMKERSEFEETGKESKRMLAARGVPTDVELPRHLKELIYAGAEGFWMMQCYSLRIKQSTMREYPAVIKGSRTVLVTSNMKAIFQVWRSLSPRDSEIVAEPWMVNAAIGVGYGYFTDESYQVMSLPHRVFSAAEIDELFARDEHPFHWAPGFVGAGISPQRFEALIEKS